MRTYWKPLVGKTKYHCWTDSPGELKISAACGYMSFRKGLETNTGFDNAESQDRCQNCLRALEN